MKLQTVSDDRWNENIIFGEMIEVLPYELPDAGLITSAAHHEVMVWQPGFTCLVLGQSNQAESSLLTEAVTADQIPVYKRPSGGETVLLSPETLVISVAFREETFRNPAVYFREINRKIMTVLSNAGLQQLSQRGISDISAGMMKVLGSSIYRKKDRVLYHAVLNVNLPPALISRYIAHPLREPDYRKGRRHEDFVTSLQAAGCAWPILKLQEGLQQALEGQVFRDQK